MSDAANPADRMIRANIDALLKADNSHQGLDTVQKICHTWFGNDSPAWIKNVSDTMTQLGGESNKLTCPPLSKAPDAP